MGGGTMAEEARRWLGYLEHLDGRLLGVYRANAGKGGYTVFAAMAGLPQGLPWCATFVHAVCGQAFGAGAARKVLGRPHPGTRVLARRMRRRGRWRGRDYVPRAGDIIFLAPAGDGVIGHCGIVEAAEGGAVTSIDGNTVDPSGRFPPGEGGAVARRTRPAGDPVIAGYGAVHDMAGGSPAEGPGEPGHGGIMAVYLLNLLDLAFTLLALRLGARELNPLMRPVPVLAAYKAVGVGLLAAWLSGRRERTARVGLRICGAVYAALDVYHLAGLIWILCASNS